LLVPVYQYLSLLMRLHFTTLSCFDQ